MRSLAELAAKAARHRQWHWCRRPNGFSDLPRWRVLAARIGLPLPYVIAFVNRLEEFANAADQRGYVGAFDPTEFATALGITADEAARIFAGLEEGKEPWVADDHVANFFDRNPDREDETAVLRKRRHRTRTRILKALAAMARLGAINDPERIELERRLPTMNDAELFQLDQEVARGKLSTGDVTRPSRSVTRPGRVPPDQERDGHAREEQKIFAPPVENSGESASGETAGPPKEEVEIGDPQQESLTWLETEGVRIVAEKMGGDEPSRVTVRLRRWLNEELAGDAVALRNVIEAADLADYMGVRFHNLIVDGIKQAKVKAAPQGTLPLRHAPIDAAKLRGSGR